MPEQFKFDFTQETPEEELRRLAQEYKTKVGVDPLARSFNKKTILAGLANPEAELARLREIDTKEDNEETKRTYRR